MQISELNELNQVEQLIFDEKFNEAFQLINKLEKKKGFSQDGHLTCQLLKSTLFLRQARFEEALEVAEHVYRENQICKISLQRADTLYNIIEALWRLGRMDESLSKINEAEQILTTLKDVNPSEIIQRQAALFNRKGGIYWHSGDSDGALDYIKQSLALREQLGNKEDISQSLNNVGVLLWAKGELNQALDNLKRSLNLSEELGNKQATGTALNNIGNIYREKGELNEALDYYTQSLKVQEEVENRHSTAVGLANIGKLYAEKGDFEQAITHLKQSLRLRMELGNNFEIIDTLVRLVTVSVDKGSIDQAQEYLDQAKRIKDSETNKAIEQMYHLAKAIYLKVGKPLKKLSFTTLNALLSQYITAKNIFSNIIKEDDYPVDAIFNLCELLMLELKICGNEGVLQEIQLLAQRLFQIGQTQQSYSLLSKTYLLQAKLSLLNQEVDRARVLLSQAQELAFEKGYDRLAIVIANEQKRLSGKLPDWLQDENVSLLERLAGSRLDGLVTALRQNRVESYTPDGLMTKAPSMDELKSFTELLGKRGVQW